MPFSIVSRERRTGLGMDEGLKALEMLCCDNFDPRAPHSLATTADLSVVHRTTVDISAAVPAEAD